MHKGRHYPFHPSRPCGLAWFWPGFLPWKLRFDGPTSHDGPWAVVGDLVSAISEPGEPTDDISEVIYSFVDPPVPADVELEVRCARREYGGILVARWEMYLWESGVNTAIAWTNQPYPQLQVLLPVWERSTNPLGTIEFTPPSFVATPANYADGGDPWS